MKNSTSILSILSLLAFGCRSQSFNAVAYQSESLRVERLTPRVYIHVSHLDIPGYGKFPCNGLVYADRKEAIVFDTPTSDAVSMELMQWIENELKCSVKAVVVNHFHNDCLGGLAAFHQKNIPSYASNLTLALAKKDGAEAPLFGFDESIEIPVGNEKAINRFFGQGHTADNIVSYLPRERMLFGGCLIKEVGAGKGNLEDANVDEWANTVRAVKKAYPGLRFVIPGHGKAGGMDLLDYTIEMFSG